MSHIAKNSLIVTAFTVLGLGLSFLSNVIIASKFGAGKAMDVYFASVVFPLFIVSILVDSLSFTFIPVFAEYRAKKTSEVWRVVSSFINLNIVLTSILCILGIVFTRPIMKFITPGFSEEKIVEAANNMRWVLPIIIFTVANELMASIYYSNQKFITPSLNKIVSPLITILCVMLFYKYLSITSIVLAMLFAAFFQFFLLLIGLIKTSDFKYSLVFDYKNSGVIKVYKLMLPLILAMIITRAVPVIDRIFLSKLQEGSISHVGYAVKIISILTSIVVSGISLSIFPIMSRYAAEQNWEGLKSIMSKGIRMLFFLSIPFTILLGFFGRSVIQLIFERGAFTPADTTAVYHAFAIYLLALPAMVVGTIVGQGYYVLQDTKTPAILGAIEVLLYVGMCFILIQRFGYLAIPIAYAIYFNLSFFNAFIVRYKLRSKGGWNILISTSKHLFAAVLVLILLYFFAKTNIALIAMIVLIMIAFILYFIFSRFIFNTEESKIFWERFISLGYLFKVKLLGGE